MKKTTDKDLKALQSLSDSVEEKERKAGVSKNERAINRFIRAMAIRKELEWRRTS